MATVSRIKATVGRERIAKNTSPADASYVRDIRSQINAIIRNYEKLVANLEGASPEIIRDALWPTFDKSLMYCPKKTLALVNSGFIEIRGKRVVMGYAKGSEPSYAAYVHELPYLHAPPTRSKFLQAALEEDVKVIGQRLEASYKALIGR
jgi:hypothetical protein